MWLCGLEGTLPSARHADDDSGRGATLWCGPEGELTPARRASDDSPAVTGVAMLTEGKATWRPRCE